MRQADTTFPPGVWRKSSYSGTQTNCVEVAPAPGVVGVRDTKHRDGGTLLVPTIAWHAFTEGIRPSSIR